MNNLIVDYFSVETDIVERIKASMPELKSVLTPFNLEDMQESSQNTPAVHVIYAGDNITQNSVGQGASRVITQKWLIVLAVRYSGSQLQKTSEIRSNAGQLIPKLLGCLQGWKPNESSRPLVRSAGAPPPGYSAAFAYFPFMFESVIIT